MRPTHVRYLIVLAAMLAAVLLYLERVCVSVAEVYVREDLRIGKMEMDVAFGAFFIAYALGQVPSGWLSQRYGPRLMLALYMLGWSVFGVCIALAQDVYTLVAARFLLGLSQAGAYPTAALMVKGGGPDRGRGGGGGRPGAGAGERRRLVRRPVRRRRGELADRGADRRVRADRGSRDVHGRR